MGKRSRQPRHDEFPCPHRRTCGVRSHRRGSQAAIKCANRGRSIAAAPRSDRKKTTTPLTTRTRQSNSGLTHRTAPQPTPVHRGARTIAKETIQRETSFAASQAVNYVFAEDSFYAGLADRLTAKVPFWRRFRKENHWLCALLHDLAEGLDPATYARQAGMDIAHGLREVGFPFFVANVIGGASSAGLNVIFSSVQTDSLAHALKILIALTCPNLEGCPTKVDVVKVFLLPGLTAELKHLIS